MGKDSSKFESSPVSDPSFLDILKDVLLLSTVIAPQVMLEAADVTDDGKDTVGAAANAVGSDAEGNDNKDDVAIGIILFGNDTVLDVAGAYENLPKAA